MTATPSGLPDLELVARAKAGDRAAFSALVARHYDYIYRVAYRWAGARDEAEDVAQEACVRLSKAIFRFEGASAFTTWLYALTLNVARDLTRKRRSESRKADAYAVHALALGEAEEDPADDPAAALWAAVRRLPDKQREAVTLVYGEEKSHSEAADLMGCAEATVSWHIHEAKKRLKALMRPAGDDAP
ncbi:MAG: RNA polymerase sigma factor [Rhizobiaceae bacterium]